MTVRGRIRGGQIVLSGSPELPEGAYVTVEVVPEQPTAAKTEADLEKLPPLGEVLMQFAGTVEGLPPDASRNHDHYLYGTPKR